MKAMHTLAVAVAVAVAVATALTALAAGAQQAPQSADHSAHHPVAGASAPKSEGEVRKVDLEQGKVTLRHGPLENLGMPAMTMVFTASDPKLLQGLKQGDKVRFTAGKKDETFFVTAIEPVK